MAGDRMPDIAARLTERGVRVVAGSPEAFRGKLGAELEKWRKVVRDAGISLDD